jgi:hypothetical protein
LHTVQAFAHPTQAVERFLQLRLLPRRQMRPHFHQQRTGLLEQRRHPLVQLPDLPQEQDQAALFARLRRGSSAGFSQCHRTAPRFFRPGTG